MPHRVYVLRKKVHVLLRTRPCVNEPLRYIFGKAEIRQFHVSADIEHEIF